MAYEIINVAQATPHRLHACLRLVGRLEGASEDTLFGLLQPGENQVAAKATLEAAGACGLVSVEGRQRNVRLAVPADQIETVEMYRSTVQARLTGVVEEGQPNYLLNLYAAWIATQNEAPLRFDRSEFETRFNRTVGAGSASRDFNTTKLAAWRRWAAFLGWGYELGHRSVFVPDAFGRVRPLLDTLLPSSLEAVPFRDFANRLANACPELDGGYLFEECLVRTRAGRPANRLSLALSSALRGLEATGLTVLESVGDAGDKWFLFPASGYSSPEITHIRRKAA